VVNYIYTLKNSKGYFMSKKNIVSIVILALLSVCLIVLVILNVSKLLNNRPHNDSVVDPMLDKVVIKYTEDAGIEYQSKLYFVGDSTTYHFHKGGIALDHIFVPESLTLMLSSDITTITVGSSGLTIAESIKDSEAEYVILTIGVNGADGFTEKQYKTYYNKLLDAINEASPNTKIIIQSVFPVTKWYSDQNKGITNKGIDRLNVWLKEIALERDLPYLDTQSVLKNTSGALKDEYENGDGVHMTKEAYTVILEYIRTHAID